MLKKATKIAIVLFAIVIGLYPALYFFIDRKFGLLNSKPDELLTSSIWNIAFYVHIIFGGIALLIGWLQFSSKLRAQNLSLHRSIGKAYVIAALLSSLAGFYIGFFATGGFVSAIGFVCLGIVWFTTTIMAYLQARKMNIDQHQRLMIYSYAACFAAVTLRIWLPLLTIIFGDFLIAYSVVAWLCWVPNILVAKLICSRLAPYTTI